MVDLAATIIGVLLVATDDRPSGWWAVLILFSIACAVGLVLNAVVLIPLWRGGYRPFRRPPDVMSRHAFRAEESASFVGGQRVGLSNSTSPLARLTFDREWAEVTGPSGVIWVDRPSIVEVAGIHGTASRGIRFAAGDGRYDGVIFWCPDPALMQALRDYGWPA